MHYPSRVTSSPLLPSNPIATVDALGEAERDCPSTEPFGALAPRGLPVGALIALPAGDEGFDALREQGVDRDGSVRRVERIQHFARAKDARLEGGGQFPLVRRLRWSIVRSVGFRGQSERLTEGEVLSGAVARGDVGPVPDP